MSSPSTSGRPHVGRPLPAGYVGSCLQRGPLAEVWCVRRPLDGSTFALKRLPDGWQDEPLALELLRNDVRVAGSVDSPYIAQLVDADFERDCPYGVFEWIEGVSLQTELDAAGPLDVSRSVWIGRQLIAGLRDLELADFTHGDVKPCNILLTDKGQVRLVDFGASVRLGTDEEISPATRVCGTPQFMAPEVLDSGPHDPVVSDIYSVGVTLHLMLTGHFPDINSMDLVSSGLSSDVVTLANVEVPIELGQLVEQMLAKDPLERPGNLDAILYRCLRLEMESFAHRYAA